MKIDIVDNLQRFNAGRDPERLAMKWARLRDDPFAFMRGSSHLYNDRLAKAGISHSGPAVWSCGDLHLENFGSYKGDNRLSYFDINDFDEAALVPATCDALRLLCSLQVAAKGLSLSQAETQHLADSFLTHYRLALVQGKSRWVERDTATGPVGELLTSLRERRRADFLRSRTVLKGRQRQLRTDGKKALPMADRDRLQVLHFMETFAESQPDPGFFKVLDMARRVAGNGSLGIARYVVLVHGKGSPDGHYLLDLKQALPSAMGPHLSLAQPRWKSEAQRVVSVQTRFQAVPMAFLHAVRLGASSYVLRALQPTEDRVALAPLHRDMAGFTHLMQTMAQVLAWGQLRSAGWSGSGTADDLSGFGDKAKWPLRLMSQSQQIAQWVQRDWQAYCKAYDKGAFASTKPARSLTSRTKP